MGGPQSRMLQDVRRHVKPAAHYDHHRRHIAISAAAISAAGTSRAPPPARLDSPPRASRAPPSAHRELRPRRTTTTTPTPPPPTLSAAPLGSAPPTRRRSPRARPARPTPRCARGAPPDYAPVVKDELPRAPPHAHPRFMRKPPQPTLALQKQERDRRLAPTTRAAPAPERNTPPLPDPAGTVRPNPIGPRPTAPRPAIRPGPLQSAATPSVVRRHPSVRLQIRREMRLRRSADPRWHSPKRPRHVPRPPPTEFHPNLCPIGTSETLCRAGCAGPRTR